MMPNSEHHYARLQGRHRFTWDWMPWLVLMLMIGLAWWSSPTPAADSPVPQRARIALVIGNSNYPTPLQNPVNDATDMYESLRELGFEVTLGIELTRRETKKAIRAFADRLHDGAIGLFFYSGHGVQVDGINYLIPVGDPPNDQDDVEDKALNIDYLMDKLDKAGNLFNIVILDACRNNPFKTGYRGVVTGFSSVHAPEGTFLAYSTAPNALAADGQGRNSPYTKHLLAVMPTPGLPIEQVFKEVRRRVVDDTLGRQRPWENTSLIGNFFFVRRPSVTETDTMSTTYVPMFTPDIDHGRSFSSHNGNTIHVSLTVLDSEHRFSTASIEQLLKEEGFEVVRNRSHARYLLDARLQVWSGEPPLPGLKIRPRNIDLEMTIRSRMGDRSPYRFNHLAVSANIDEFNGAKTALDNALLQMREDLHQANILSNSYTKP